MKLPEALGRGEDVRLAGPKSRRLSKDYEFLPESSEAMIQVSMIHLMLRRLRPIKRKRSERFRYAA